MTEEINTDILDVFSSSELKVIRDSLFAYIRQLGSNTTFEYLEKVVKVGIKVEEAYDLGVEVGS